MKTSPYCAAREHDKCIGRRWDLEADDSRPCECRCHEEKR